jgi:hypothetical protein
MRELYINYTLWKQVAQDNSFTIYEQPTSASSAHLWCGTRDVIYRSDVAAAGFAAYEIDFPAGPGRVAVLSEDEAIASIIGLATVLETRSGDGTLAVASQRLGLGREAFVRTDNGTELMNIDGLAAGAPVVLWNGGGAGDIGADWTPSGNGSETAGAMHSGTNGWDTGVSSVNDTTIFDNGAMIDIGATYDQIDIWINPQAFPPGARLHARWRDDVNANVGDQLRVDQYAPNMDIGVYQQISIPIADFNLTGNAQKLRIRYSNAAGQHYFFDDIELVSSAGGGPHTFRLEAPDALTRYHLTMAVLLLSAPTAGWTRSAFADIVGGLNRGLIMRHRKKSTSEILWRFVTKNNVQLFGQYHPQEDFAFADNELLVGFMVKPGKASVIVTDDEVLEFVVRDKLDTIPEMRAYAHFGVEVLTP